MVDDVRRAIHRLAVEQGVPTDGIVIMSPLAAERSAVWREKRLGNFALVEQDHKPGPREIRFTSLQRFKGLEADIVVLCEVQDDFEGCSPMHLYVGTSRAKHLLEVYRYAKDATP